MEVSYSYKVKVKRSMMILLHICIRNSIYIISRAIQDVYMRICIYPSQYKSSPIICNRRIYKSNSALVTVYGILIVNETHKAI